MLFDFKKVEFETVKCITCNSDKNLVKLFSAPDRLNKLPGAFYLVKCKKCGLVFQNPRPTEKYIKYYYPESTGYFNSSETKQSKLSAFMEKEILVNFYNYNNLGRKNIVKKVLFCPIYIYFFKHQSIPQHKKDGTLLEIGCSNGIRLKKLKDIGWKIKGIEPSSKASEIARIKRNLDVETGSIFDFDFPEKSFDAIILDMALEHLYNPDIAIQKISKWIKPGGQLIFSIPYFNGIEYKLFKEYSYGLQLPTHITFFNKESIFYFLKDNFNKIKIIFHHFDRDVVASAGYKYQDTHRIFYRFISSNKAFRFIIIKPLVYILSIFKKTSRVTVFAIKK